MRAEEIFQSNLTDNTDSICNQTEKNKSCLQNKLYFKCTTEDSLRLKLEDIQNPSDENANPEKPFRCSYLNCNVSYRGLSRLIVHLRTHTGEKPFKCSFSNCTKTFNEKGNLKTHMRIHTGEKPFICSYAGCLSSFKAKGQLAYHMKIHQKSKPYNCEVCQKRYTRISTLKIHSLLHQRKGETDLNAPSIENSFSEEQSKSISIPSEFDINNILNQPFAKQNSEIVGSKSIFNNNNYFDFGLQPTNSIMPQMNNIYRGYYNQSYLDPSLYSMNANLASYALYNQSLVSNYLSFVNQGL